MQKKNLFLAFALSLSIIGLLSVYSASENDTTIISAQDAVENYLIDKDQKIGLEETSIARTIPLGLNQDDSSTAEDETIHAETDSQFDTDVAYDISKDLPEHNMADYFRYLQTELAGGNTPSERTEFIRDYLLSSLPSDKAGELIDLYERFTTFESDVISKAEEWKMPENASETLALIDAMQDYQQAYFGEDHAQLLFGAEMKVMEYNARRAIIINDPVSTGDEKEQLLDRLGSDMWGEIAYRALNENKDPYDVLDEKLLVYGNELAALDPYSRKEEISRLRDKYLPAGW